MPGLGCFLAIDQDLTGHDQRLGFLAGFGEAAVHDHADPVCFSRLSVNNQIGDLVQPPRTCAKRLERFMRASCIPPAPCTAIPRVHRRRER